MNRQYWYAMANASADDWQALMQAACQKRQSQWGKQISYSRKVFIPLTNLCRDRCGYCTFVKQPGQCGAGYLSPDEVMAIVRRGEQLGCKEALFSLGEKPELRYPEARLMLADLGYASTLDYLVAMCQRVLQESALIPHINCGTASIEELVRIKEVCASFGIMLESVSQRLLHKGGAHHACPDKVPKRRLATLEAAGELNLPTTSGILMGIGETWAERIDSLYALAELRARFGHIQEVIVQNFRAKAGTAMAQHPEPTMDDMLRTLTAARLILPAEVSLQAPPNLQEDFERYLHAGINDFGGISPVTQDHINPERAWPAIAEIARRTAAQGLELVERLSLYPAFQALLSGAGQRAIAAQAGCDGLAREQSHLMAVEA